MVYPKLYSISLGRTIGLGVSASRFRVQALGFRVWEALWLHYRLSQMESQMDNLWGVTV